MRRICCFCESWESGGIESFLNNVLSHMDRSELEVDIVASCLKQSVFTAGLEEKGIRFVELSGSLRRPLKNGRMFRQLLRERHYDAVHFNLFQGLSLRLVHIAKRERIPVRIVHGHGTGLRDSRTKPLKMMIHRLGKHLWGRAATDHWACSRPAAEFLFPRGVSAEVIRNGIETEKFRFSEERRKAARDQLGLTDGCLIGTVGRLSQEKNQQFLLDVFAHICEYRADCRLLLVGDGPLRGALTDRAKALGIGDRVIFYGTSYSVEDLLCAMDLFLFPSRMEGLGIAAIEAQASGLPVLCSDRISDEARLTEHLKTLPLGAGAHVWAEEAMRMLDASAARDRGVDEVKAAGFDIEPVARRVEKSFLP